MNVNLLTKKWKEILLSLSTFLLIFLIGEVGFSTYYYHKHCSECSKYSLAWEQWIEITKETFTHKKVEKLKRKILTREERLHFKRLLFVDKDGKKLLNKLVKEYEYHLKLLIDETNRMGTKLLILHIPLPRGKQGPNKSDFFIDFVRELATKYEVDFLDLRAEFIQNSPHHISLLPEDDHLSRFGNIIVAQALAKYLKKYQNHRIGFSFAKHPPLFGDLEPSSHKIWDHKKKLPYLVTTNRQGLRMGYNVGFPKTKSRVLFLGDSLTFGPYVPNAHTFPAILSGLSPDIEVINAGVFGYTITDEAALFLERAKYTEPDIVVLQVFSNDIHGLLWYMKNIFARDRDKQIYQPSELEKKIWNKVRGKQHSSDLEIAKLSKQHSDLEIAKKVEYNLSERLTESHFKSYHEFATHACIPCHYGENGTNLVKPIEMMTEDGLKNYLEASLNHGKMPPDEIFRKILLGKFNFLKKHLETDN